MPDGGIRWVRDSILARPFGENQVRLDGVITDVTERRMAVEALEKSESRLKGILSSMTELVFAFDTDMRFIFYHAPDMKKLYMQTGTIHRQKSSHEVMPPEHAGLFSAAFETTGATARLNMNTGLPIEGEDRCFSAKLSSIIKEGQFDGVVAVVRDITEHKKLQEP